MESRPVFSIKYENPRYPGYICTTDWDYGDERRVWSRSIGLTDGLLCFEYTPPISGLDFLAAQQILKRFGLLEWENEIPVEKREVNFRKRFSFSLFNRTVEIVEVGEIIILRLSPAQLIDFRREKEKIHNLPRLEVVTDNLDIVAGKGKVLHYAEEYK